MKIFQYDSPLIRGITCLSRLTLLNLIWLVCCIPIVTIGASTIAMHYSAYKLLHGDSHVFVNYKEGWRLHWKKASIAWIFQGLLTAAFIFFYLVVYQNNIPGGNVLTFIAGLAFLIMFFVSTWLHPIMIQFLGNVREYIFNAFVFAFMYAPFTLLITGIYVGAAFLFMRFLLARGLIILFGPALVVYITLALYGRIFKKYKKPAEEEEK